MAVAKFREAHVNKRAEYYQDDMLDELLRELERMEIVVFYWLKGHSGAVANEMADLQATRMLEEAPMDEGERPKRRHASLTFAFDRRPFRWAAETSHRDIASNNSRKLQQLGTQVTINVDAAITPQRLQHEAGAAARSGDLPMQVSVPGRAIHAIPFWDELRTWDPGD